ncbi:MAG: HAD family phosphatase [bacterium]|nr:HAD family phosphatase [bacterium]
MNTYQGSIYISDLDGTLLRKDAMLSPYSQKVLTQLLHQGLAFTVASARSVVSMQSILQGLPLSLPVIEFNGAFISDVDTGHHRIINSLDASVSEEIYQCILDANSLPFISTFNGTEDCLYYSDILNEGMAWYLNDRQQNHDRRLRSVTNLTYSLHDQVVCLTVIGASEALSHLKTIIQEQFGGFVVLHFQENFYSPGWYWLTIHDRKATKDQAIRRLVEEYHLQDRELVVFGDQCNDIEMFHIAHRRVAVDNAIEELKHLATTTTASNQHDGVVKFIERDWEQNNNKEG